MLTNFETIETGVTALAGKHAREVYEYICEHGPVCSSVIERRFDIAGTTVRGIVSLLRSRGYAICSGANGYYIAVSRDEIMRTVHHLEERIHSMQNAANGLRSIADTRARQEQEGEK